MTPRYDCPCQRGGTDVTSLSLLHSPAERHGDGGELIAKKMTLIIEVTCTIFSPTLNSTAVELVSINNINNNVSLIQIGRRKTT